jgi:hypothetical protein
MATASSLETTIGGFYKSVPHLPKTGREWLADNVWWLALVGAILSTLGALVLIPVFFAALTVTSLATGIANTYGPAMTNVYDGLFWLSTLIGIAALVIRALFLFMAFGPLKLKKKRGWTLLFWAYLIGFALSVVGDLVTLNVLSVVVDIIAAGIAGYFLFEIHGLFGAKHKEHKVEAK